MRLLESRLAAARGATKNWSRKHNHAPFEGDLSSFWQDLVWSPYIQKFDISSFSQPEIWMGPPKFTSISANTDKPHDAALRKIDHITLPTKYNYQAMSFGR